jgi:site-specific DNA recombinase
MKVAIYARVSSDAQDIDLSLSAQLNSLRDYANKNNHDVVSEFVDEAESGRTADRPAFKEMIAQSRLKNPPFEAVLVWKLNRFARSRVDSITYKTLLRSKGIDVISINEPVDDSPTGRLLEGVIESIDEFYSANLGQDIKRGLRENAKRGFFNGNRPPYGFHKTPVRDGNKTRHRLEPDPEYSSSVATIRRIFELALREMGCKEIAKKLNREGLLTAEGKRWGKTTVHKVLTNEAYCGTLVWGGRQGHPAMHSVEPPVRVDNAWPAIIERDVFDRIQRQMSIRRPLTIHPRTIPSPYLLSGIVFCGCGHAMIGHSAKSHRHFYYMCSKSCKQGRESCVARMIPKERLENAVIDKVREIILADENLETLVELVNEELKSVSSKLRKRVEICDTELRDVKARLSRHYDALETGSLGLEELAPRIKELKSRQDELNKMRIQLQADMVVQDYRQVDKDVVRSYTRDLRHLIVESELIDRKTFLRSFVKRIVVTDGKVTINYNLPLPSKEGYHITEEVLSMVTPGGEGGTRTPTPCGTRS